MAEEEFFENQPGWVCNSYFAYQTYQEAQAQGYPGCAEHRDFLTWNTGFRAWEAMSDQWEELDAEKEKVAKLALKVDELSGRDRKE